jgi:hypothetical protein
MIIVASYRIFEGYKGMPKKADSLRQGCRERPCESRWLRMLKVVAITLLMSLTCKFRIHRMTVVTNWIGYRA